MWSLGACSHATGVMPPAWFAWSPETLRRISPTLATLQQKIPGIAFIYFFLKKWFRRIQKATNTNLPIRHSVSLAAQHSATVQSRGQFIIIDSSSSPTARDIAGVTSHHQSRGGLKGNRHENPGITSHIRRCCFNQFEESGSENTIQGKHIYIYIYMYMYMCLRMYMYICMIMYVYCYI